MPKIISNILSDKTSVTIGLVISLLVGAFYTGMVVKEFDSRITYLEMSTQAESARATAERHKSVEAIDKLTKIVIDLDKRLSIRESK